MSETREEYARGIFESRRRDFLRDLSIKDLAMLLPNEAYELFHEEDWDKEELIDVIIINYWDRQINPELK